MKQTLVIVRGASCSGKTTICKEIRDFDKKIAWISVDNVKLFFSHFKDEAMEEVNKTSLVVLKDLLDRGYSVIMDGIFKNPQHLLDAVKVSNDMQIPVVVYELEASLETLKQRDKTREGIANKWFPPLGEELIESLYRKVVENPIDNVIKINTEEKSVEECVKIIKGSFE